MRRLALGLVLVVAGCNAATTLQETSTPTPLQSQINPTSTLTPTTTSEVSNGLALPFRVEDVKIAGEFISPFGVVRHSRDSGHGHGGIDIPLQMGAPLYAVADGTIISAEKSVDGDGGADIKLLIMGSNGEGWGFLYEHATLEPGIVVGDVVTQGQLIARNVLASERRNNHLQFSFMFNDYLYYRDHRCWADLLDGPDEKALQEFFDSIRSTETFINAWRFASEDGMKAYESLLDEERFPQGPQLCYLLGLDVRVPE